MIKQERIEMKNRHPEYLTTPKERGSYWIYFVGQNLIYYLVTGYLVPYTMMFGDDVTNPATIMTDPGLADRTYIAPIEPDTVKSGAKRS